MLLWMTHIIVRMVQKVFLFWFSPDCWALSRLGPWTVLSPLGVFCQVFCKKKIRIQCEIRHQKPTFDWEHEESSFKMLLLAMEENPEIKMTKKELDFVRELICGGDKEKERKGEYPYSARGPDKFYLYEIIANKVPTK